MNGRAGLIAELSDSSILMPVIEERLHESLTARSELMTELALYTAQCGGKRLRPMLLCLCASCFRPDAEALIDVAAASELIHVASLIHDDVIDKSDERRGRTSLNSLYGNRTAVLTGDFLFATAFRLLNKHRKYGVLHFMTSAIRDMCEGEIEQAASAFDCNRTERQYLRQIRNKTASLLAACCQAGAAIGGASRLETAVMRSFGVYLGYAFQITDDILDMDREPNTGKPSGQDLRQGILTLPVIRLLSGAHGHTVRRIIESRHLGDDEITFLQELARKSGTIASSYSTAAGFVSKAKKCLGRLPDCSSVAFLDQLADSILERRS